MLKIKLKYSSIFGSKNKLREEFGCLSTLNFISNEPTKLNFGMRCHYTLLTKQ